MKLRILKNPVLFVCLLLLSSMFLVADTIYLPLVVGGAGAATGDEVFIPAGVFQRGCVAELNAGLSCFNDHIPVRPVYLDDYYIDKFEVSNGQYEACVTAGDCTAPSQTSGGNYNDYYGNPTFADFPVVNVTWFQAEDYCLAQNKRLPTEAEWEKAARGDGYPRTFPWGEALPACEWTHFLFVKGNCADGTLPVDFHAKNNYSIVQSPYGVYGMEGNVHEWVNDYYQADYYSEAGSLVNPAGPGSGSIRVLRGGSWQISGQFSTVFARWQGVPTGTDEALGFRCARTPSP